MSEGNTETPHLWEIVRNQFDQGGSLDMNLPRPLQSNLQGISSKDYILLWNRLKTLASDQQMIDTEIICMIYLSEILEIPIGSINRIKKYWESRQNDNDISNIEQFFQKYQIEEIVKILFFIVHSEMIL